MATDRLTLRLSPDLMKRLRSRSRAARRTESALAREALELYLGRSSVEPSAYDLAKEAGLIGIARNLPKDLSTNPRYMEGFGEGK